jgi:glycosyltransferase involved in cell wall biosynthesis
VSARVWIDVTDFLKWRGSFTAFQHIQYNMAKEYIASDYAVSFFVYDQLTRRFIEVAFDPDTASKNGIIGDNIQPVQPFSSAIKRFTPKIVKRAAKKALRMVGSDGVRQHKPLNTSPFRSGDKVVVLGGIWHGTFADDLVQQKNKKHFKLIHIVHDMIPVVCPQYVVEDLPAVFASYKEKIFANADGLIINSQSSKRDALAFMEKRGIKAPPDVVFRLADQRDDGIEATEVPQLKNEDFILLLGTIEGRKNHALLYYAYKQAMRNNITLPKLVIAGRAGWLVDDILYTMKRDPELKDQIILLDLGVTNSERVWLYQNCLFTVWPSFYEGWGMPVAESMTYGKVCISTDVSAMPEIAPRLVETFSPYEPSECLKLIVKYTDAKVRQKRESEIKESYKTTTWHEMFLIISSFIAKV